VSLNLPALLAKHGVGPKKAWSQNFLHDRAALAAIAGAVPVGPLVVEIGAGPGNLTGALMACGFHVIAVEPDPDFNRLLHAEYAGQPVTVLNADGQTLDAARTVSAQGLDRAGQPLWVVGNLPYAIASGIIFNFAAQPDVAGLVIMIQKEMAQRLAAPPGSRDYGSPSAKLQLLFDIATIRQVPRGAFIPPPRVDSTVLRFTRRAEPRAAVPSVAFYNRVVDKAFSQRRKMLSNTIRALLPPGAPRGALDAVFAEARIAPTDRAEVLGVAEFARLAWALAGGHPAGALAGLAGPAGPHAAVPATQDSP